MSRNLPSPTLICFCRGYTFLLLLSHSVTLALCSDIFFDSVDVPKLSFCSELVGGLCAQSEVWNVYAQALHFSMTTMMGSAIPLEEFALNQVGFVLGLFDSLIGLTLIFRCLGPPHCGHWLQPLQQCLHAAGCCVPGTVLRECFRAGEDV